MQHHLEVQIPDDRAGCADVVPCALLPLLSYDGEGAVDGPQSIEHRFALTIETLGRRDGEDSVALELRDFEHRLHALDHDVKEGTQHLVPGRYARAEVHAV